ncbi:MAG: GAF domain-containing protein [Myxococcales bacterium]
MSSDTSPPAIKNRRLAIAFEASQDLYFLGTPVEGLEFAVKLLSDLVPCDAVSACIYDINTDEFRFVALTGPGGSERRAEAVPSTEGLLAAAVRAGKDTFVASNVENDPRYDPAVDGRVGLTVDTIAYLLLQKGDNLLGILQLINRRNRTGFTDADMAVAGYLSSQVAEFLQARRGGRR